MNPSVEVVAFIAGVFIVNLGALFSAYVSLRERLTRIEVKVDTLERDVNGIGAIARANQKTTKENSNA